MNKLTKVLSVFLIAGAIGTGVAGAAGCAHKHTFNENEWKTAAGSETHWHPATCGHDVKKDEEKHADTNGDGKCDKCEAAMSSETPGDKLVIKKEVDGLIVEGVTGGDVQLSKEKKSHDIDKTAIKVYTAVGTTKGDEVPAANLDIKLTDPAKAEVTDWSGLKTNGTYKIDIKLKNAEMEAGAAATVADLATTVSINIKNAVVANSLTLKEGTVTQAQSSSDSMTSTWKFEVERANGDKVAVTGTPEITGLETVTAGENKTATVKVTVEGVECTGTVTYTITANTELRIQSYAYNFGFDPATTDKTKYTEDVYLIDSKPTDHSGTYALIHGATNGAHIEINKPRESADGEKYFTTRFGYSGGTFTSTAGTVDAATGKDNKYIEIKTESAGKITVYWSRNSSKDTRGIALWTAEDWKAGVKIAAGSAGIAEYDFSGATTGTGDDAKSVTPVGHAYLYNETTKETLPTKAEFTVPAAGVYYLTTATSGDANIYYIQIDNEYNDGTKENIPVTAGEKVVAKIAKSHSGDEPENPYVQQFDLGGTFNVDSGYTFKATSATANTAAISEETVDVADLEFYIGTTKIIPGTTVLDDTLITTTGVNKVTVKYGGVELNYDINVVSSLGVDTVTAALKSDFVTELANAEARATVKLDSFALTLTGANKDTATASITAGTYKVKDATGDGTAIDATNGVELGAGDYVITLTVHVTHGTDQKDFTANVDVTITVAGNEVSWLYQTSNATQSADNTEYVANSMLANTSLITVQNLVELKNGVHTATAASSSADFPGAITDSTNKPVLAAAGTMSGQAITFTNALAFTKTVAPATEAVGTEGQEGYKPAKEESAPELIKITANKKIKVYLYINACDSKHGGNRKDVEFYVKKGDGEYATTAAMTTAARKSVQAFILELEEGDVVTIKAKRKATTTETWSSAYIWFYGFEAKVVA